MPEASGSEADPAENRSSNDRGGLLFRPAGWGRDAIISCESGSVIQAAAPDATATAARTPSIHSDDGVLRRDRGRSAVNVAYAIHPRASTPQSFPAPAGIRRKAGPIMGAKVRHYRDKGVGRGPWAAAKNAIIPQNHQIVSISPRAGQGAFAPVPGGDRVKCPPPPRCKPARGRG